VLPLVAGWADALVEAGSSEPFVFGFIDGKAVRVSPSNLLLLVIDRSFLTDCLCYRSKSLGLATPRRGMLRNMESR
jgi:hypothetical protein